MQREIDEDDETSYTAYQRKSQHTQTLIVLPSNNLTIAHPGLINQGRFDVRFDIESRLVPASVAIVPNLIVCQHGAEHVAKFLDPLVVRRCVHLPKAMFVDEQ